MQLYNIIELLEGKALCCEDKLHTTVQFACAGDLMSELLVDTRAGALLITGLVNHQVIRTAELLDLSAIAFIRGKNPSEEMLELATETGIPLISTQKTLYNACGLLYQAGLRNLPEKL